MDKVDALAALRERDFARYAAARFLATLAWQMLSVGGVGADLIAAAILLAFTASGGTRTWPVLAAMAVFGGGRAFWMPAGQAIVPSLVPPLLFPSAVAINSTLFQVAVIGGPALGGLLYLLDPLVVYASAVLLLGLVVALIASVRPRAIGTSGQAVRGREVLEGVRFVFRRRTLLGAISLDLFAVLFGGATALLPMIASDVLRVGPAGLGILRTAPAVGAALTAGLLAVAPVRRRVGRWMFAGVAVFGLATIVFGLSRSLWLSLVSLFLLGAGDMLSVYVRHMLVQLETPDAIRGRVSAVNSMFIGASNELGEFRSGVTAHWLGLVPAVVLGGAATLLVVADALRRFPELRRMDRLPEPAASDEAAAHREI